MMAFLVFSFGALLAATIMALTGGPNAAYWRVCALLLWLGAAGFLVHAAVDGVVFAVPLGIFFLVVGVVGVVARVVTTAVDLVEKMGRKPTQRRTR